MNLRRSHKTDSIEISINTNIFKLHTPSHYFSSNYLLVSLHTLLLLEIFLHQTLYRWRIEKTRLWRNPRLHVGIIVGKNGDVSGMTSCFGWWDWFHSLLRVRISNMIMNAKTYMKETLERNLSRLLGRVTWVSYDAGTGHASVEMKLVVVCPKRIVPTERKQLLGLGLFIWYQWQSAIFFLYVALDLQ